MDSTASSLYMVWTKQDDMNYSSKSCVIKCQHCSEEILHSAKVCRFCNRKTDDWTKGRIDKDGMK